MSFTRETLSIFLSEIYVTGKGKQLNKFPDKKTMKGLFKDWILLNKSSLIKNKKAITMILADLRIILLPVIWGSGENIGLKEYISEQIIQDYSCEINREDLNGVVEETIISAASVMDIFFEILEQELKLDSIQDGVDSESEWGNDLLNALPEIPNKIEREEVLKEVFYKETKDYIFHQLKNYASTQVATSQPCRTELANVKIPSDGWMSDGESEEASFASSSQELFLGTSKDTKPTGTQWRNLSLEWRLLIIGGVIVSALIAPVFLLAAVILWDLIKKREKKELKEKSISSPVKSEIFKAIKPRHQNLARPRELLSDEERGNNIFRE
jgi:hypothetical protein